jgi:FtsH-binding integral membrane protein
MEQYSRLTAEQIKAEQASFMTKVYGWMSVALLITGFVAMFTASTPAMIEFIFGNMIVFWGLFIGEVLLVGYLASAISGMSANMATAIFLSYAAINGLTLSAIFLIYTAGSIASTFFITAGTFAVMSVYGYFTKTDLTSMGNLLFMALIGLVIASVVNIFLKSEMLYWISTYVGVIIFVGLTAYDTQKVKEMNVIGNEGTDDDRKEAISGALTLYLDFIGLFLYLLRIFGNRK